MVKRMVVEASNSDRGTREARVFAHLACLERCDRVALSKCLALLTELAASQIK